MIATPLTAEMRPLYPVTCPICGAFLGALYRDGLSMRAAAKPCTPRCVRLWQYGHGRPRWRELPPNLRQIRLAAGVLEHEASKARTA